LPCAKGIKVRFLSEMFAAAEVRQVEEKVKSFNRREEGKDEEREKIIDTRQTTTTTTTAV